MFLLCYSHLILLEKKKIRLFWKHKNVSLKAKENNCLQYVLNIQNGLCSAMFLGDMRTFLPRQCRAQGIEDRVTSLLPLLRAQELKVYLKIARATTTYTQFQKDFRVNLLWHRPPTLQIGEAATYCGNVAEWSLTCLSFWFHKMQVFTDRATKLSRVWT